MTDDPVPPRADALLAREPRTRRSGAAGRPRSTRTASSRTSRHVFDPELGALQRDRPPGAGQPRVRGRPRAPTARPATTPTSARRRAIRRRATTAGDSATGPCSRSTRVRWATRARGNPDLPDDCWPVSCAAGSEQETCCARELAALPPGACVLAYWHHPRESSGFGSAYQPATSGDPAAGGRRCAGQGAALILTGHSHNYERFDLGGGLTAVRGGHRRPRAPHEHRPAVRSRPPLITDAFGVLELTLSAGGWSSRFVAEGGVVRDSASRNLLGPARPRAPPSRRSRRRRARRSPRPAPRRPRAPRRGSRPRRSSAA